jgi:hypothetical protein
MEVVSFTTLTLHPLEENKRWMGLRVGLETVGQRKSLTVAGNRTSAVQLIAHRYTVLRLL